jgi:hypothetical protein
MALAEKSLQGDLENGRLFLQDEAIDISVASPRSA